MIADTADTCYNIAFFKELKQMKATIRPSWLAMSENKLYMYLTHREFPAEMIKQTMDNVKELKKQRKAQRIKATMQDPLWNDMLRAARTERDTVRVMKTQTKQLVEREFGHPANAAKLAALTKYEEVIMQVIAKMEKIKKRGTHTPLQVAAELKKGGRVAPEVSGEHWTHYVSPTDKAEVFKLFDKFPDPARGKKKVPFEYRISRQEHERLRQDMSKRLQEEAIKAEQELALAFGDEEKDKLNAHMSDIREAQFRLEILPATMPIPKKWKSLIGKS
jgi:GTP-binding protein EngB required for normal cell division